MYEYIQVETTLAVPVFARHMIRNFALLGEPLDKEGLNTKYVCSPLPDIPCTALALADLIKHTTNEVLKGITYLLDPKVII